MFEQNYQRAVDVRNKSQIVYAYFHADKHSLFMPANDYSFFGPMWIVWFPATVEYTNLHPEEFDDRYVLEDNLPEDIRRMVNQFPSYTEWVDVTNGKYPELMQ